MSEDVKYSSHYTVADIKKYLAGELSPAEMHAMEKAALDDPFLADAMEGMQSLQSSGNASFDADVAALKQRLQNRTTGKRRTVIFLSNTRWWQVAAVVLVVVAIGITYPYLFKQTGRPAMIAKTERADSAQALTEAPAATPGTEAIKEPSVAKDKATAMAAPPEDLHPNSSSPKKKRRDAGIAAGAERKAAGVAATGDQPVAANKVQSAPTAVFKDTGKQSEPIAKTGNEAEKTDTGKNKDLARQSQKDTHLDDEVVVVGYGKRSRKAFANKEVQNAEPVAGWEAYRKYLKENRKAPQDSLKGEVVVSFRVKRDGKLSGFNIEKSLGPDYDAEAIRLIKEGPAWKVLKGKKARITVAVEF